MASPEHVQIATRSEAEGVIHVLWGGPLYSFGAHAIFRNNGPFFFLYPLGESRL